MARYFFDVAEGGKRSDWVEAELPDGDLAKQYALGLIETLMRDRDSGDNSRRCLVVISTKEGKILDVVKQTDN